jgi:ferritin-like protein
MTSDQSSGRNRRENAAAGMAEPGARLSRKRALLLLGTSAVGATTIGSAGCGAERPAIEDEGRSDVELLNYVLELEHATTAVYGSTPGWLGPGLRSVARQFAEQAAERVAALTAMVEDRGGAPLEPKPDEEYLEEVELKEPDGEEGFIRAAIALESTAVAGYSESVSQLSAPELRRTFYELAGNSAAHITVLLGAAGEVQVPDALVTGQPA